jgi:hypothetical protein
MKKNTLLLLLVISFVSACRTVVPRAEVTHINTRDGVIYIRANGYGTNRFTLQDNAERTALEVLLYRGIPGSQQNLPLISEEYQAKFRGKPGYVKNLLDAEAKKYRQFITRSEPITKMKSIRVRGEGFVDGSFKPTKIQEFEIGINLSSLRRDMEANNVIRGFGY